MPAAGFTRIDNIMSVVWRPLGWAVAPQVLLCDMPCTWNTIDQLCDLCVRKSFRGYVR